ncbi:MAG TPA: PfkB family carbohydrate kinase [Acetobacteraceae bacterium]|nr:PfkB family carbohydrate kinase [Acetobacteraceae bacterium]
MTEAGITEAGPSAAEAIGQLARARVLVVGDAMLDRYVFGTVGRISPEAPVPVLMVEQELAEPGGAGNVVHNLCALGAAVAFVSVVGDDPAGAELTGLIGTQAGVEPWLLVQGGRITTTKTRFVAEGSRRGGQQLLRADHEDSRSIHPKLAERLLRIAGDAMAATSLLVLSDYRKGVLAGDMPALLIARAHAAGRQVVADLRAADFARYAGADVLMPHASDLLGPGEAADDAAVEAAGQALRAKHGFGALLVKRGEDGLSLVDGDGARHFRLYRPDLVDLSGAGDAALAALAAGLAAGQHLALASRLANSAAGLIGATPGSVVARPQDLLAAVTLEDAREAG